MITTEAEIPKHFICPLTNEIMKHPVMTKQGHCFERSAVMGWMMKQGCKSEHLSSLSTNWQLRKEIWAWKMANSQSSLDINDETEYTERSDFDGAM